MRGNLFPTDAFWQETSDAISQTSALLPVKTVGAMGDARAYDSVCGLRAVTSTDGMTADVYPIDAQFLTGVATRIVNEGQGINRMVYDYASKAAGHDRVGVGHPSMSSGL